MIQRLATQQEIRRILGDPHPDTRRLVRCTPGFRHKIAWDISTEINSFMVHPVIKAPLEAAFHEIVNTFTHNQIVRYKWVYFGGCYNYRRMRGGTNWSTHAWAIAFDINPLQNSLKTRAPQAAFSTATGMKYVQIMERYGFLNYGKYRPQGNDWMHFEASYQLLTGQYDWKAQASLFTNKKIN